MRNSKSHAVCRGGAMGRCLEVFLYVLLPVLLTISPFFMANRALMFVEESCPSVVSCCWGSIVTVDLAWQGLSVQPHRPQTPATHILLIPWTCDALPVCPTTKRALGCSLCLHRPFLRIGTQWLNNNTSLLKHHFLRAIFCLCGR